MEETKKCKTCLEEKNISEFYARKNKFGQNKYSSECKICTKKRSEINYKNRKDSKEFKENRQSYSKEYRQLAKRTPEGWYSKIYYAMRKRNKENFDLELPFTKEEFIQWINDNYKEKFERLFKIYVDSNCDKYLCPSIDRIDDYKSYTFDNMQLLTWKENDLKGTHGIKNKVSCAEVGKKYCSKTVLQYDLLENLIMTFSSTHEVERITGIDASLIARACRRYQDGYSGYAKGYYWHYKDNETNQNNEVTTNE